MRIRNVHRRAVDAVDPLLDDLGSIDDRLWPRDRWPAVRLDRPLEVGARGGHDPIRYRVELYEPNRRVRFRFERPRGFDGLREFCLVEGDPPVLEHLLEAELTGTAVVGAHLQAAAQRPDRGRLGQRRVGTWFA